MDLDDELRKLFADERLDVRVRPEADRVIVSGARRVRRRRAGVVFGGGMLSVATMLAAGTAFGVSGDAPQQTTLALTDSARPSTTTTPPPATTTTTAAAPTTAADLPAPTATRLTTSKPKPTTTTPTPTSSKVAALAFGPTTVLGLRLGMSAAEAMATGLIRPNPMAPNAAGCVGYDWAGGVGAQPYALVFSPKDGLVRIGGLADAVTPEGIHDGSSAADVRVAYPLQTTPHAAGSGEWVAPAPGNPNAHYWILFSGSVVSDLRLELAVQDCDP
ncbi:hypothetical protein [Kutzneria sp. NPDC052558]|uniref:hypothetical protein n=1 Tax=Kutzneria sp. NPDC052558 TaxID=3364121 RepID=UPI0037C92D82